MSYNTHANLNTTWNTFLDKFNAAQAQSGGTLKRMYDRLSQVAPDLCLFSKTGTPDAYVRYEFPMLGGNNRFIIIMRSGDCEVTSSDLASQYASCIASKQAALDDIIRTWYTLPRTPD